MSVKKVKKTETIKFNKKINQLRSQVWKTYFE